MFMQVCVNIVKVCTYPYQYWCSLQVEIIQVIFPQLGQIFFIQNVKVGQRIIDLWLLHKLATF